MKFLQSIPINSAYNRLQQVSEPYCNRFHFLVERIVQYLIIEIAHEVDKAFLLRAVNVIKADASEFSSYLGDAVITDETNHNMYHIFWDSSAGAFSTSIIGTFPNQPEDGIFLTTAILTPVPEPETYAMFMAGLGLMGFIARRRKNVQA